MILKTKSIYIASSTYSMKKNITTAAALYNSNALITTGKHRDDKYKAIVENSMHAFFLLHSNGSILELNPAAATLFGYTARELNALKIHKLIDNSCQVLLSAFKQQEETITVTEATGITKDGIQFPIEISTAYFIDTDSTGKYSTMISNISVRKKIKADLQLNKERYDLVVKATKDLVWDWDLVSGEIYRSGHNLSDVYGHSSNEFIKTIKDWSEYIHPQDKEKIKAQIDYYIHSAAETDFTLEYRFRKEDGNYVYINDKGYIIRNGEGKAIRMIGAAEDITERKKATLAIEESEMRYKMFVKQSTEGIWRIELNEAMHIYMPIEQMLVHCMQHAYIAECNDAFARTYGFEKAEDILGSGLSAILPETNPLNQDYFIRFFKNGFRAQDEISYETDKDGNEQIFLNNMIGVVEGDYIRRAWGTQRNITSQKKAEQHLVESENHVKAIINADPECIKLLSREGIILEINPSGLKMTGAQDATQVIGKNAMDLILPEYHEGFKRSLNSIFEGNTAKNEFEIKGLDGQYHFMESNSVPLKDAAGNIVAALAVTRDITESKNAQVQLQASEEKYRYLFNNNPASILIWDAETQEILEVNQSAIELYDYSRDEFLALNMLNLAADDDDSGCKDYIKNIAKYKDQKATFDCRHLTKKGSVVIMETWSHEITYKTRHAILTIANNITEKVQLENILNEERQLRHQQVTEAVIIGQEKERTELGQELHDNINQILASTKLYIECAMKDENPRKDLLSESKSLVERAMTELRILSKSLLPPSLGETGLQQALLELTDNIKQVNELTITIDWTIKDEHEISKDLKLTIFRIAQEQLNNIIKHAQAKNAAIKIAEANDIIEVNLTDDGLGFNTSLKRNGVGLRNITSRAEVNNGKVSLVSTPGEGCQLIVKFPAKRQKQKKVVDI